MSAASSGGVARVLVHVDLDGLWALRRVYGLEAGGPSAPDPLYDEGLPRLLDLLDEHGIRATFFVIGRDTEEASRAARLEEALRRGHALAAHGWDHAIGPRPEPEALRAELRRCGEALAALSGVPPRGYRAPGFQFDAVRLAALADSGFGWDSSLLPARGLGFLRRASARLSAGGRAAGGGHYGGGAAGLSAAPRDAYRLDPARPLEFTPEGPLWELPLAVTPWLRLPLYHTVCQAVGWSFFGPALGRALSAGGTLVYLLHLTDVCPGEALAGRVPGGWLGRRIFLRPGAEKEQLLRRSLALLGCRGQFGETEAHLAALARAGGLSPV